MVRDDQDGPVPVELLERDAMWEKRNPSNMHAWTVDQILQHLPGLQDVARLTSQGPAVLSDDMSRGVEYSPGSDAWSDMEVHVAKRTLQVLDERKDASNVWEDRVKNECRQWERVGIKRCCKQAALTHPSDQRSKEHIYD